MDLGIVGLAQSGKTTLFNAVTRGHASAGSYAGLDPGIGVVKIPDERLDRLCETLSPRKVTNAEVRFLDFPGGLSLRGDAPPAYLAALSQCDALVHVVRAFRNEAVPHPEGSVDHERDIAGVNLELAFADSAMLERRAERLSIEVRSARPGERAAGERETALLERLRDGLDNELPLRDQTLSADERRTLSGYQLLTNKPLLIVVNIDEADVAKMPEIEAQAAERWAGSAVGVGALCAKLEQELTELSDDEAEEFRNDLGLAAGGPDRLLGLARDVLGLITFFTVSDSEGRAWPIARGATALEAAGKIHTEIERGFIRCETIGWQELVDAASYAGARKRGTLRIEGKQYVVQDGEALHILFNV